MLDRLRPILLWLAFTEVMEVMEEASSSLLLSASSSKCARTRAALSLTLRASLVSAASFWVSTSERITSVWLCFSALGRRLSLTLGVWPRALRDCRRVRIGPESAESGVVDETRREDDGRRLCVWWWPFVGVCVLYRGGQVSSGCWTSGDAVRGAHDGDGERPSRGVEAGVGSGERRVAIAMKDSGGNCRTRTRVGETTARISGVSLEPWSSELQVQTAGDGGGVVALPTRSFGMADEAPVVEMERVVVAVVVVPVDADGRAWDGAGRSTVEAAVAADSPNCAALQVSLSFWWRWEADGPTRTP